MGSEPMGFGVANTCELWFTQHMPGWNAWYHISGHTYGSWLPGDERGWRLRHHRGHIEGDYKNPPPKGAFKDVLARSRRLMKREPVTLSPEARRLACDLMARALVFHELEPLVVAVDSHHYHILARFHDHNPRKWVGIAKSRSARAIAEAGWADPGGVWAIRCKVTPINDRAHQVTVFKYILKHANRGAALWTFNARERKPTG